MNRRTWTIRNTLEGLAVLGAAWLGGEMALRDREIAFWAGVLVVVLAVAWWVEHRHRRALSDWYRKQLDPLDAPDPSVHDHMVFKD